MAAPTEGALVTKGSLYRKLAKIIGEIQSIPKSGHNDFHNYDYVTANDLINAVRDKLAAAQICVFTSVEKQELKEIVSVDRDGKEKKSLLTLVTLKHTFADGESGETFEVLSQGQGADVGDKGGYKAITGAMKYFVYKCFMIPTDEDGTEIEHTVQNRGGGRSAGSDRPASPVASGQIDWRKVRIHFGVYKDKTLGDLSEQQLRAWFNWKPNPRYKKAEDDLLVAALKSAETEVNQ